MSGPDEIRDILAQAKKALEYSSSSLESIESFDDEDRRRAAGVPKRNLKGHQSPNFQKAASTAIAARRA